jgi:PAS domain S-box-containing protein
MQLTAREILFKSLFDSSPDAIFIEDAAGTVLDCNPAAAALHAMSREQIIGLHASDLVPREHRSRFVNLQENAPREFEGFSLTADGRSVPVSIRTSPIEYLGQPALLLHVRDISASKHSEQILQRAHDELEIQVHSRTVELERANEILREEVAQHNRAEEARKRLEREVQGAHKMEAVGRLAGGVAHDFNNLLTVIINRCELVLNKLETNDSRHADLVVIRDASQKAAKVTRQLLAFGRKQVLQTRILNLNAVIRNMDAMLRSLVRSRVTFEMDFCDDLLSIEADRGQIEQVLMNLVVNALDAMPDGGALRIKTVNVDLDGSTPGFGFAVNSGRYAMFSVQDTGCGIDPSIMSKIFEPFFTTKDKINGSGLGLPTVYGIVKQSGGYITVSSRPGEGATFNVYLPGLQQPAEPLEDNERSNVITADEGNETILLAEDSDLVRQLTREMLEIRGYHVLEASNGNDALEVCRTYAGPIGLTLSDVVMPGMTGRELAERVVKVRPDMKVLLMSGYTDEISKSLFVQGGVHFIEKPFTSKSLAMKIREVLDAPSPPSESVFTN